LQHGGKLALHAVQFVFGDADLVAPRRGCDDRESSGVFAEDAMLRVSRCIGRTERGSRAAKISQQQPATGTPKERC
jgi:hypothetical protein